MLKLICNLILVMFFVTIWTPVHADSTSCILDKRAYGNWQSSQQQGDYNKSKFYEDRAHRYREQGRYDLERNERQWKRLYDTGRDNSRRYHEFYGPYNRWGGSGRHSDECD